MTDDISPDADNENVPVAYCALCFHRRAVLVEGGGPNAFCIKCMEASRKRHANDTLPTDPYLNWCACQVLGLR